MDTLTIREKRTQSRIQAYEILKVQRRKKFREEHPELLHEEFATEAHRPKAKHNPANIDSVVQDHLENFKSYANASKYNHRYSRSFV